MLVFLYSTRPFPNSRQPSRLLLGMLRFTPSHAFCGSFSRPVFVAWRWKWCGHANTTVYLGNVVYAFAGILAVYLGATFLGSTIYRRWMRTRETADSAAAWVCLGFVALLPLAFADPRLPGAGDLDHSRYLFGLLRAVLGIGPFSAMVGFLTPMLVDVCRRSSIAAVGRWSRRRSGSRRGSSLRDECVGIHPRTAGVAGFWILPWAGERWGLCLLAIPLFAIGWWSASRASLRALFLSTAAASVILAMVTRGYDFEFPR